MPKLKSNKAAKKRFYKITKTGKIKRGKAFKRHILTSKNRKRKRHMRHSGFVSASDTKGIKKLLPYG